MSNYDVCQINTSKLDADNKLPLIQATVPVTGEDDVESFGEVASYQALGLTTLPYPPSEDGAAEGVILRDVGNLNGAIVGARDDRCAAVVANMQPGDAVLHSCDPQAKAQVRVHANRQIALVTEGSDGKTMLSMLDGKNDKITISAFGGLIEMTPDGISIVAPGSQASIILSGEQVTILGKLQLGGYTPSHVVLCATPAVILALQGVFGTNLTGASGITTTGT